jgi:hypothetical protein
MMLGVADAIVELTGVQAGFLGVTDSPLVAGIAGLIVGVAAAISMGAASYLQARAGDVGKNPAYRGVVTGLLYMLTVIALASPYFIIKDIFTAFTSAINSCSSTHSPPNLLHISDTGKKLPQRVFAERLDTIGCRFWHISFSESCWEPTSG